MPSPRQIRMACLAIVTVALIMFFTSSGPSASGEFYSRTMDGMKKALPPGQVLFNAKTGEQVGHIPADKDADGDVDEDDKKAVAKMQMQLKQAEQEAKAKANSKGGLKPDMPSKIIGMGNSAGGQAPQKVIGMPPKDGAEKVLDSKTKEDAEATDELNAILKRAPVVIFSKTYCPHSKTAKGVLLEKYIVEPEPLVVELDTHPLGAALQAALAETTGRRTVPNVLVSGVSIGGGDEVVHLDHQNKLADKLKMLGNKRVKATKRFVTS